MLRKTNGEDRCDIRTGDRRSINIEKQYLFEMYCSDILSMHKHNVHLLDFN